MLCKVQVILRAAHYCAFAYFYLLNYRNINTTTLNLKCMSFLFIMFAKHCCKVEFEAKFDAKFSHLAILQPVKLAFDCH